MLDLENQGDRAGAQTASLDPEREWTDRAALARAVAGSTSREEAIAIVAAWDVPVAAKRPLSPADRTDAAGARAVATVAAVGGPPRRRPRAPHPVGPLFARRGAAT